MGRETALAGWELTWDLPRGKSQDCQEEEAAPMGLGCPAADSFSYLWEGLKASATLRQAVFHCEETQTPMRPPLSTSV